MDIVMMETATNRILTSRARNKGEFSKFLGIIISLR